MLAEKLLLAAGATAGAYYLLRGRKAAAALVDRVAIKIADLNGTSRRLAQNSAALDRSFATAQAAQRAFPGQRFPVPIVPFRCNVIDRLFVFSDAHCWSEAQARAAEAVASFFEALAASNFAEAARRRAHARSLIAVAKWDSPAGRGRRTQIEAQLASVNALMQSKGF